MIRTLTAAVIALVLLVLSLIMFLVSLYYSLIASNLFAAIVSLVLGYGLYWYAKIYMEYVRSRQFKLSGNIEILGDTNTYR